MAPPVTFNGGHLSVTGLGGGPVFQLFSTPLLLTNRGADPGSFPNGFPAAPGVHSINATFAGELGLGSGYAEIGGAIHQTVWYTGELDFSGHVTLPASAPPLFVIVAPFKMKGTLQGFASNPMIGPPGPALFDHVVHAHGKAVLELTALTVGKKLTYNFSKITYDILP